MSSSNRGSKGGTVAGATPAAKPVARRVTERRSAERSPELATLDLAGLRAYRTALGEEESQVSYWRRILQARLDVVRAGSEVPADDVRRLRPVLSAARVGAGRRALLHVVPASDVPPLPNLTELWERVPVAGDPVETAALLTDLEAAEEQLSEYRAALHAKIDTANDELIARYRDEPGLCLTALPLPTSPVARRSTPV